MHAEDADSDPVDDDKGAQIRILPLCRDQCATDILKGVATKSRLKLSVFPERYPTQQPKRATTTNTNTPGPFLVTKEARIGGQ